MRMSKMIVSVAVAAVTLAHAAAAAGQAAPEHDASALAKTSQNPVGDLVSLPFQFNFNNGGDLEDATFLNLNFQPVIPFRLNDDWSVIARTIVPVDSLPGPEGTRFSGVGDIQEQLFFTPAKPGGIIWGVGPVFSLPTSTVAPLQTGSWAAGPGAVIVKMAGPFVAGGLINQYWTFADSGNEVETNLFLFQPFINFNFGQGWALAFAPVITANWDADAGEQWTVPLGMGISRTTVFNSRPMTLGVQYYYNVERPTGQGASQLRIAVSLLYPKRPVVRP